MPESRSLPVWRVATDLNETLGTSFAISPKYALTCHHVVDGTGASVITLGSERRTIARIHAPLDLADSDIAVLELAEEVAEDQILPVASIDAASIQDKRANSAGFHLQGSGARGALPANWEVRAPTDVTYALRREYSLSAALTLSGTPHQRGMSGAPLIDTETRVVVGVVSSALGRADYSGFAVPISAVEHSSTLQPLLAWNDAHRPRYGRFLSRFGLERLCNAQVNSALGRLEALGVYERDRVVLRTAYEQGLAEFLVDGPRCLVIVGRSGEGKTCFLAEMMRTRANGGFLLRCAELRPSESVRAWIERELAAASVGLTSVVTTWRDICRVAAAPPMLAVDALNEVPRSLADLQNQVLSELAQLTAAADARIIVTIRPEWWDHLSDVAGAAPPVGFGQPRLLKSRGYDAQELSEALRVYESARLDSTRSWASHPLLLRLAADVDGNSSESGPIRVAEEYVKKAARSIELRTNRSFTAKSVDAALDGLGHKLGESASTASEALPKDQVWAIVGGAANAEHLCAEGLLEEVGDVYRFTFDLIAEFCMVRALRWQLPSDPSRLSTEFRDFLIEHRVKRSIDDDAIARELMSAVEQADVFHHYRSVIVDTIATAPSARPFAAVLAALVKHLVATGRGFFPSDSIVLRLIRDSDLDVSVKLDLLREVLLGESSHIWRSKDRQELIREVQTDADHLASLVVRISRTEPRAAMNVFLEWLGDDRKLVQNEATVADVAETFIGLLAADKPRMFLDALARSGSSRAPHLVREVGTGHPNVALEFARGQLDVGNYEQCLDAITGLGKMEHVRADVLKIAREIAFDPDAGSARQSAIGILLQMPRVPPEVWPLLTSLPHVHRKDLPYWIALRIHDGVLTPLGVIEKWVSDTQDAALLGTLCHAIGSRISSGLSGHLSPLSNDLQRRMVAAMSMAAKRGAAKNDVAGAIEGALYSQSDTACLGTGLLALAVELVDAGDVARRRLFYAATSRSSVKCTWAGQLFERIVEAADLDENTSFLREVNQSDGIDEHWQVSAIHRLLEARRPRMRTQGAGFDLESALSFSGKRIAINAVLLWFEENFPEDPSVRGARAAVDANPNVSILDLKRVIINAMKNQDAEGPSRELLDTVSDVLGDDTN